MYFSAHLSCLPRLRAQFSLSMARLWRSSSSATAVRACTRYAPLQPRPSCQTLPAGRCSTNLGRRVVCAGTHRTPVLSIAMNVQPSISPCCAGLLLCEVQWHGGCASGYFSVAQSALVAAVAQPSAGSPRVLPPQPALRACSWVRHLLRLKHNHRCGALASEILGPRRLAQAESAVVPVSCDSLASQPQPA